MIDSEIKSVQLFYNPQAGSIEQVLTCLRDDRRVMLEAALPEEMEVKLKRLVEKGAERVFVCGGDGTIALAAAHLAGTDTEMALVPGGTLNHFAERHGIPTDVSDSLDLALHGRAYAANVGFVNDRIFINTSSVGAYSVFVRSRKYLQNRMSYMSASILSGLRRLFRFRSVLVSVGGKQLYTPLVFIGVDERELLYPSLGQIKKNGQESLHLIAVKCSGRREIFKLIFNALFLGVDPLSERREVENQIIDSVELNFHHGKRQVQVALDGELTSLHAPLKYRFAHNALKIVTKHSDNWR